MKRKKLLTLVGSICLTLVLAALLLPACAEEEAPGEPAAPEEVEVLEWRFAGYTPAGGAWYKYGQLKFVELIEEYTMGRIELTPSPGGTLFPVKETLEAIGEGVAEVTCCDGGYFRGKLPVAGADNGMPLLYPSTYDILYCNYELGSEKIYQREYGKFNIRWLGVFPDSEHCLMSVDPIRTLDDFVGMKVRSYGSFLEWYESLGMETVFLPHDEMYMALQLGTVNAYSTDPGVQWDSRGHEVCKYYYVPSVGAQTAISFMNLDAWNSLPPDLQQSITAAARQLSAWMVYSYNPIYGSGQALTWFDNYGLERIEFDAATQAVMLEKAEALWKSYAETDAASAEILNNIMEYLEKKRAGELP